MDQDHLRQYLKSQPFAEFDIKTTHGDTFRVFHPDFAMISPKGDTMLLFEEDNQFRSVDMSHIVALEPVKVTKKRTGKR